MFSFASLSFPFANSTWNTNTYHRRCTLFIALNETKYKTLFIQFSVHTIYYSCIRFFLIYHLKTIILLASVLLYLEIGYLIILTREGEEKRKQTEKKILVRWHCRSCVYFQFFVNFGFLFILFFLYKQCITMNRDRDIYQYK